MKDAEVIAVNRKDRLVLLDDGTELPITVFLDEEGDETDDVREAIMAVAGKGERWYTVALLYFTETITFN